jgi:hypothetical protein
MPTQPDQERWRQRNSVMAVRSGTREAYHSGRKRGQIRYWRSRPASRRAGSDAPRAGIRYYRSATCTREVYHSGRPPGPDGTREVYSSDRALQHLAGNSVRSEVTAGPRARPPGRSARPARRTPRSAPPAPPERAEPLDDLGTMGQKVLGCARKSKLLPLGHRALNAPARLVEPGKQLRGHRNGGQSSDVPVVGRP